MSTALVASLLGASCGKVPLEDVAARFDLADATWFEGEQTLFLFYDVRAEQGLSEHSVVEVRYRTDDAFVDWTPLRDLPWVHEHVPVDCGTGAVCGSASLAVAQRPRGVQLRLRYHEDGELSLDSHVTLNIVGLGPAHTSRSLVVYGVFDETNDWVQWRGRHTFPRLRNEQVQAYGLRRWFEVTDQRFGAVGGDTDDNPYLYGATCSSDLVATTLSEVSTLERAVFNLEPLPLEASSAQGVCAQATVHDATGDYSTQAIARKNPEVRPAFPTLNSPTADARPLPFFLAPCRRSFSPEHEAMQRQRLHMESVPTTCIDDWQADGFADALAEDFLTAIEAARPDGQDLVLVVGLHRDEAGVPLVVEEALAQVVPQERHRNSPRVAGAFVFDTEARGLSTPELVLSTLWCPASYTDGIPNAASFSCALSPDDTSLDLGPFSFGTLPVLPTLDQYEAFVADFGENQAGEVTDVSYRAPVFSTTADHVDVGDYGVVTFLDEERVAADADDAFSYCAEEVPALLAFRTDLLQSEWVQDKLGVACEEQGDDAVCEALEAGVLPLEWLPRWHNLLRESSYELGLFWDFPFLLRLDYELVTAGSVTAVGFSVPFGFKSDATTYLGTSQWLASSFSLERTLAQCDRFCDHPTFDSAGIYQVRAPFRETYEGSCYAPLPPELGDSGFPLDP